jgi:hypothetical protein
MDDLDPNTYYPHEILIGILIAPIIFIGILIMCLIILETIHNAIPKKQRPKHSIFVRYS